MSTPRLSPRPLRCDHAYHRPPPELWRPRQWANAGGEDGSFQVDVFDAGRAELGHAPPARAGKLRTEAETRPDRGAFVRLFVRSFVRSFVRAFVPACDSDIITLRRVA